MSSDNDLITQLRVELQQQLQEELQHQQQQLREHLQQQREELQNQRSMIQTQQDEILSLKASLVDMSSQSDPTSKTRRPKASLPDPDWFSGQAYKFDTWLPSIKAKLRSDAAAIGGDIDQFYYVYLNLENSVQSMVLPQLDNAEEKGVWDYNTILAQLKQIYDNPNKIQEAEDRLHNPRQGNESISVYIAKFERLLYAARGQDWPDTIKITTFRNGLNHTTRQRLNLQLNLPRDYPGFIHTVQQLSSHSFDTSPSGPLPDRMDTSIGNINAIDPVLVSLEQPSSPSVHSTQRARSTSPARRQQYRENNQCVRCGLRDHWVAMCPLLPSGSRKQMAKRVPASNQGDTDDDKGGTASDSDGWGSILE